MKTTVEEIIANCDAASGLTKFMMQLAIQSIEQPSEIPSLEGAPSIAREYRKVSFEGIKCAGKDYHIRLLLERRPDLVFKPKFRKIFPFKFLEELREGSIFGGFADSLLLASAYAYDEEFYAGKGSKCYVQNRGVYTFATMEVLRLEKEMNTSRARKFIVDVISAIGLPDLAFYLDVDLETAIVRSRGRNANESSKLILEGTFLKSQKRLQKEYDFFQNKFSSQFYKINSQDAQKNIDHIVRSIDGM